MRDTLATLLATHGYPAVLATLGELARERERLTREAITRAMATMDEADVEAARQMVEG